jgi:putative peptidoglycan binding protein
MKLGETRTVALSGSGSYYISAHSRPGTVANSISGSTLTLTGTNVGSDNMGICSSGSNTVSCANLTVTVTALDSSTSNSGSTATISFSPNSLNLIVGQTQTVTVTGSGLGSYYISENSGADAVGANLVGNTVSVTGIKMGGGNITVCQLNGQCGSFYAYVPAGGSIVTPSTPTTNQPLVLSSFGVSSNNVNNKFLGAGVALTVTFSVNQAVTSPTVSIAGSGVPIYGGGSGPYTAIYTMNGNEPLPLSVDINFGNSSARFTVGGSTGAAIPAVPATPIVSQTFTAYLEVGSTGAQVTALQNRLTALGVYSGPITGTFGGQTEAAVKKYQAKHGVNQLGAVGPATRALLNQGI